MKKKIFMITLAACLVVLSIAGSSMAYFTDVDEKSTVFTAGNVDITLAFTDMSTTKLFPGQTYASPAVITNEGSESAYVGAIITMTGTGLSNVVAAEGNTEIPVAITNLIKNLGAGAKVVANGDTITVYVVNADPMAAPVDGNKATYTVFDTITIPASWNHEQVNYFTNAEITVKAYATQTVGFNDAKTALKAAFATDWASY